MFEHVQRDVQVKEIVTPAVASTFLNRRQHICFHAIRARELQRDGRARANDSRVTSCCNVDFLQQMAGHLDPCAHSYSRHAASRMNAYTQHISIHDVSSEP